tara:strand:- start:2616 stop:2864 length:249 start_codon:yes stop_codon:yes gene_type:complete
MCFQKRASAIGLIALSCQRLQAVKPTSKAVKPRKLPHRKKRVEAFLELDAEVAPASAAVVTKRQPEKVNLFRERGKSGCKNL